MTTVAAYRRGRRPLVRPAVEKAPHRHWYWLCAGLVLFFSIPFVLTDLVSIDRDLYYGIYVGTAMGFLGLWLRFAVESSGAVLTRRVPDRGRLCGVRGRPHSRAPPRPSWRRCSRAGGLAAVHRRIPRRLLGLPRRQSTQTCGRRPRLERPDPSDVEPARVADHTRRPARRGRHPQLRHRPLPAAACRASAPVLAGAVRRCELRMPAGVASTPGVGHRPRRRRARRLVPS
jgi:hypothetical protein